MNLTKLISTLTRAGVTIDENDKTATVDKNVYDKLQVDDFYRQLLKILKENLGFSLLVQGSLF